MKHGLIASLCGRTRRLMALGILIPAFALAQGEDPVRPDRPEQIRFPEQQFHPPKPERVVLKNGLVVYLLPDPMIPQIRLSGLVHAGSLRETAKESGLAGLTAEVLRLGGSTITPATEMNRLLEYAGADLEAGAQRDYVALSLRVLSKDRDLGIRLLGEILLRAGVAERMYEAMVKWLSWIPGGLMHSNIGACAVFAATSGSSVATAATVGTVALPLVEKHGYDERLFLGTLAAGGTLGILIPPSINMIIYAVLTDTSIPQLYLAGIVPGLA
ncbi:MAG: TRAP transporter large permease subunit, partial [Candidatus Omnitrophica bacterium]|nr:TRAP transporter large permease subunit [Candidatus Omnitrophota bacterium]